MKKQIMLFVTCIVLLVPSVFAAGTHYEMRVDGLACPFCAYGIEKKLKAMDGISNIKIDLDNGVVSVDARQGIELTEDAMTKLFHDSGFTYRSMKKTPVDDAGSQGNKGK